MKTLNYLMLLCVLFGIASCYYIRAPYRISSSGIPPRPIGLFRPLRQRLFPGSSLPRMTTITRGRRIAPPLALGRRISSGRIGGSITDLGRSIPLRRIGGSLSNNNDENNNNIGRRIGISRFQSNNINDNNLRIRPSIGSGRLFSLSAPPPIVPRQIRYLFDSRPRISGTSSVRRISSSRRVSPSRLRLPSSRLSTTSLRRISTRQGQIPGVRRPDQVMALFAVDGPSGVGGKTSSIQGQGLSKLPFPAEMVAKSTSVRRIGKKASKVGGFRTSKKRSTSKIVGAQIKKSEIIKKELKTTKTKLTVPEAKIVASKIKTQEPIVVPAAILPTETKTKAVVKQGIKISDADTVNIKTSTGVKATEKVKPFLIKEQHGSGLDTKASKVEASQPILKTEPTVAKSISTISKEDSPIKAVGLTKGSVESKIGKVVAESAAVPVIIPDTQGKIADTSVKSNIKINDADTVNIKTGTVASSGEVTGGIKTTGKQAVIVPDTVITDKTKVVVPSAVTIDKKEVVAAKTAVTDIKQVAGKVLADKKTVIADKAVVAPDTKGHVHVH